MQELILIIGCIAFIIFAIQFTLSLFGFDSDVDLGDVGEFSVSDLISFKGLIHFIMGFTTYLYPEIHAGYSLTISSLIIATLFGIAFVIGLYYVYRSCKKLEFHPQREQGNLDDRHVKILRHERELTYVGTTEINGAYDMFTVESNYPLTIGESYKISKFTNNKIYIQ